MDKKAEVIIIGGGIAGLAAAIALRQRGVAAVVYEQAAELREVGAGLLLAPNACAVLHRLGALESLMTGRSTHVRSWELRDWRGRELAKLSLPREGEPSISTRRSDLQWALRQCLPDDAVLLGREVVTAAVERDGVRLSMRDGSQVSAPQVFVADGSHSRAREALWPGREPAYRGYIGWRGLVDHVPVGWEGRVSESWGQGQRFGLADVGGGRTYWYASANVPEMHCHERVSLAEVRRRFASWHAPVAEILDAMNEETLLQHPIGDRCPMGSWQCDERAVMLGDAAHPLTPNLGQGAAMALEDAWVLAVQWGQPDAMARYQRRRRLRVMTLWGMSRWIGTMIQCEQPWLCKLRDLQMRLTPNVVATVMMRALLHDKPEDLPTV